MQFDVTKTKAVGINKHLYLLGYTSEDIPPPVISQGYRIGSKQNDAVYLDGNTNDGLILMTTGPITATNTQASGVDSSAKVYTATLANNSNGTVYAIGSHQLKNGESIRILSETGDLPENIEENKVYYAITNEKKTSLGSQEIQIASSRTNAEAQIPLYITSYGGEQLRIESRVSDKEAGELGHPIQWDPNQNQWFIHVEQNCALWQYIQTLTTAESEISYVLRKEDDRSLDEKLYKIRYVVPKELVKGKGKTFHIAAERACKYLVEATAHKHLHEYTRQDALDYRDYLIAKGLAGSSISRIYNALNSTLNFTINEYALDISNPFSRVYFDRTDKVKKRLPIPTPENS